MSEEIIALRMEAILVQETLLGMRESVVKMQTSEQEVVVTFLGIVPSKVEARAEPQSSMPRFLGFPLIPQAQAAACVFPAKPTEGAEQCTTKRYLDRLAASTPPTKSLRSHFTSQLFSVCNPWGKDKCQTLELYVGQANDFIRLVHIFHRTRR